MFYSEIQYLFAYKIFGLKLWYVDGYTVSLLQNILHVMIITCKIFKYLCTSRYMLGVIGKSHTGLVVTSALRHVVSGNNQQPTVCDYQSSLFKI